MLGELVWLDAAYLDESVRVEGEWTVLYYPCIVELVIFVGFADTADLGNGYFDTWSTISAI